MQKYCRYFGLLLLIWAFSVQAKLQLPALFSDHMVLQRNKPVLFCGESSPQQTVKVMVNHLQVVTKADDNGQWQVVFPATKKGGPFKVKISTDQTITLEDVYFGDVWIAGGQSNMEWKIGWNIDNYEQELLDSHYPKIRFFEVPNTLSPNKEKDLPVSEWKLANGNNAIEFSAVAWFFAKHLHTEQDVAVGILDSNWGGTPAEAWMDADKVKYVAGYEKRANKVLNTKNWPAILADNDRKEKIKNTLLGDETAAFSTGAFKTSADLANWQTVSLPLSEPISDVVWLRKNFELIQQPNSDVTINLGYVEQQAMIYLNDKFIGQKSFKDTAAEFTFDKNLFNKGTNVLTLRAVNAWSNLVKVGRIEQMWVQTDSQKVSLEGDWLYNNQIEQAIPHVERFYSTTGFLYNAMIHPLLPYTSKGVIWYQGESNAHEHTFYHELFTNMITNWRTRANDADLPFLFVQLAAFLAPSDLQPKSNWAYLRDAQKQTLALKNTAMAVTIDIGDPNDIHPRNKQDVGKRLWLQAAKHVYGQNIVAGGPDYVSHNIQGDEVVVSFNVTQNIQTTDGNAPIGFIIAGEDRKFYQADARIIGNKVIVSSPKVAKPKAIRYAWANYPKVNLVNDHQLPAIPFRTDNWPIVSLK